MRYRRRPWTTLLLCAGIVAAAGFTAGALTEHRQSPDGSGGRSFSATAFASARAAAGAGGLSGGAGGAAGSGAGTAAGGGATTGTVLLVDGDTIYLTESSGTVVKVVTGKSTPVLVNGAGTVAELKVGRSVTVRGVPDSSGDLAATSVTETGTGTG